jgi:tRNA pseudouridine38-40 synthase
VPEKSPPENAEIAPPDEDEEVDPVDPNEAWRAAKLAELGPRFGVLLKVAYDGTGFSGWAAQKGRRTVCDTLNGAIVTFDPRGSMPRATSRTDAGVHAEGQIVAFDASMEIPPRGWVLALNQHLPDDVAVRSARAVPPLFNPRYGNKGKRYRYRILLDRVRDPAWDTRAWRCGGAIDLDLLEREARVFEGSHDFAAFRSAHDPRAITQRTMSRVGVERAKDDERIVGIVVEGSAFLHNMVRIMVGTLVDVARGKLAEGTIARALAGGERRLAGTTAPAHGLTLERIDVTLPEGSGEIWPH